MNAAVAAIVLLAGLAVGATSIGGVLVVPALTALAGLPIQEAIAVSNFSFLFIGVAAFWQARRSAHFDATANAGALGFAIAALFGAALGAASLHWLPTSWMRSVVAVVALGSGVLALTEPLVTEGGPLTPGRGMAIALLVGCLSAWSGTGGPVLLLPILMLARVPTLRALAMAQAVQLPIALAAATVNLGSGRLDVGLGVLVGVLLLAGWWAGWKLARHISVRLARRLIGLALIGVGILYAAQTLGLVGH